MAQAFGNSANSEFGSAINRAAGTEYFDTRYGRNIDKVACSLSLKDRKRCGYSKVELAELDM